MGERREEENGRQGNGKRAGTSSEIRVSEERNAKPVLGPVKPDRKYIVNGIVLFLLLVVHRGRKLPG